MKKLFFLLISFSSVSFAQQNLFHFNDAIPVTRYGNTLKMPWAGGIDYPQFSEIDLNQDGKMDLFMFDRDNNRIIILINDGSIGPQAFHDSSAKYAPMFPTGMQGWASLYDYNCDGLPDLFTPNSFDNGITEYQAGYSNGVWTFTLVDSTMLAEYGTTLSNIFASQFLTPCFIDMDNDGDMDIVGKSLLCPTFTYYKNYSMEDAGRCDSLNDFKEMTQEWGQFVLRSGPYCYVVVDQYHDNTCAAPAPSPGPRWPSNYVAERDDTYAQLFTIDLNGDGIKDALIGDSGAINVLAAYNGGTLQVADMASQDTAFPSNSVPARIHSFATFSYVDVDNDTLKDLLVGNREFEDQKGVLFYKNSGTNASPVFNFQNDSLFQSSMIDVGEAAVPVFFDADGDGLLDLVIAGTLQHSDTCNTPIRTSLTLYKNVGNSSAPVFQFVTDDYAGISAFYLPGPLFPAFGDLDGNGSVDMLIGQGDGKLTYCRNTACGTCSATFASPVPFYDSIDVGNNSTPQIVDLDGDGVLDLVIGAKNGFLKFYKNTGTATSPSFSSQPTIDTLGKISVRPTGYVDGYSTAYVFKDNGTKLLVSGMAGDVLLYDSIDGNLNGSFGLVDTVLSKYYGNRYISGSGPNLAVSGGDINNDGFIDMMIGIYTGGVQIYYRDSPVSVEKLKQIISFDVFPNPASESLTLNFYHIAANQDYRISIFNSVGEVVYSSNFISQTPNSKTLSVDLHNFANGLCLVKVQSNDQLVCRKVVVNRSR